MTVDHLALVQDAPPVPATAPAATDATPPIPDLDPTQPLVLSFPGPSVVRRLPFVPDTVVSNPANVYRMNVLPDGRKIIIFTPLEPGPDRVVLLGTAGRSAAIDVRVVAAATNTAALVGPTPPTPWWTRPTAVRGGVWGFVAIAASAVLAALFAPRRLALSLLFVAAGAGQLCFGWAMALLGHGDGVGRAGPLLWCCLAAVALPAVIPLFTRRRRSAEVRRMRAMDAVAV